MNSSENKDELIRTYSKVEFSRLYLVGWKTIKRWVGEDNVIELDLSSRDRTIPPKKVEQIFEIIGKP